jgi:hypothetical protein
MDLLEDGHRCQPCTLTGEVADHEAAPPTRYALRVLVAVSSAIAITFVLGLVTAAIYDIWGGKHYVEVQGADGQIHHYGTGGGSGLIYLAMFGIPPVAIATGIATFFLVGRRRRAPGVPAARVVKRPRSAT